jgi:hypothetical protein
MSCRSDFSREHRQFATKVAPTNTCKALCVLCASARKQDVKLPELAGYGSGENLQQLSDRIATSTH